MQADEAGKAAEVVAECLVERVGLPAEACEPPAAHMAGPCLYSQGLAWLGWMSAALGCCGSSARAMR